MKITHVEATCLSIAAPVPLRDTTKPVTLVLVRVGTDGGVEGFGFTRGAFSGDAAGAAGFGVREIVHRDLAELLNGKNPLQTEAIWLEATRARGLNFHTRTGILAQAISAVDQALWDIKGKVLGQPVYRLLGGARDTVEVYTTFGLAELEPDELAQLAAKLVAQGHDKLKMQTIAGPRGQQVDEDVARVRLVREAVGSGVRIMLDANSRYDFVNAVRLAKGIEEYDVTFIDDPVYVRDMHLMVQLRQRTSVPIAARGRGENVWDARDLIANGAVDVMQVSVLDGGGFSESLKIGHMAQMYHLPVATGGGFYLLNAHLLAGLVNGWMTEYHLILETVWETLFTGAPRPVAGVLHMPDTPGLGFGVDEAAVRRHTRE
jgi:L-rhamnonate dehydratase